MNLFRLSLNLLRRDWRAGEWRVLLIADLRITSTRPLSPFYRAAAQARGLQTVLTELSQHGAASRAIVAERDTGSRTRLSLNLPSDFEVPTVHKS
jgi:hypothetical protein